MQELPAIEIHTTDSVDLYFEESDELACKVTILNDADSGRVSIMDVPPPVYPKRGIICTVTPLNATTMDVVFAGNLRPFHSKLDEARIPQKSVR